MGYVGLRTDSPRTRTPWEHRPLGRRQDQGRGQGRDPGHRGGQGELRQVPARTADSGHDQPGPTNPAWALPRPWGSRPLRRRRPAIQPQESAQQHHNPGGYPFPREAQVRLGQQGRGHVHVPAEGRRDAGRQRPRTWTRQAWNGGVGCARAKRSCSGKPDMPIRPTTPLASSGSTTGPRTTRRTWRFSQWRRTNGKKNATLHLEARVHFRKGEDGPG